MRARRSAYEPAGPGFTLAPVSQVQDRASRPAGPLWRARASSVLVHAGLLALLLVLKPGAPPGEPQNAPAFAIEFSTGTPDAPAPSPAAQAQVNLGGEELPPPPERSDDADSVAVPLPRLRYGSALKPRANPNPFANVVPNDLAPAHTPRRSAAVPDARYSAFAGGPDVHAGRLSDAISHPAGSEVSGDYDAELRAFVEAHKEEMRPGLEGSPEGQSVLQVTLDRDGRVTRLHLAAPSSSARLNEAWVAFFRGHRFPPLSADITGKDYTLFYELDYTLTDGPPPG